MAEADPPLTLPCATAKRKGDRVADEKCKSERRLLWHRGDLKGTTFYLCPHCDGGANDNARFVEAPAA